MKKEISYHVGRLFVAGFPGPEVDTQLMKLLVRNQISGVILFSRNIQSLEQVRELNSELGSYSHNALPLMIGVDQEGGRVARLKPPFINLPPMRRLGNIKHSGLVRAVAEFQGLELRELGFNVNFAPVLDVFTNPANTVIGDRAFSSNPLKVAQLAIAFFQGLRKSGVLPCGKHFPGHGDTFQDSHLELPVVNHPLERLMKTEIAPFEMAVQAGMDMLMTAHVKYPALDPNYPATLSQRILTGLLRNKMNFHGVIVSDDLDMKAVANHFPVEEIVIRGVHAGVDLFLACADQERQEQAIEALTRAVEDGKIPEDRIKASLHRIDTALKPLLKQQPLPEKLIGSWQQQAIEDRIAVWIKDSE
ncbi:MAG: Beta-hexosaminidase [Myxococcota bacterium]|nr:Beta-hexosaminidase [Myxococcota bacterium]